MSRHEVAERAEKGHAPGESDRGQAPKRQSEA